VLVCGRLSVADKPIGPEVRDINFNDVLSGLPEAIDAHGKRLLPESACGFAVNADGSDFVHFAEIEPESIVAPELSFGQVQLGLVRCGAREVADPWIRRCGPEFEFRELNLRWRAPISWKADSPGTRNVNCIGVSRIEALVTGEWCVEGGNGAALYIEAFGQHCLIGMRSNIEQCSVAGDADYEVLRCGVSKDDED
jgi:hypothetical protein